MLQCRYSGYVLVPHNGLEVGRTETSDGVAVMATPVTVWNNTGGIFDEELDSVCQQRWGVSFARVRSVWQARIGATGEYWHLVKLEKI